ncbi:MAG TPA: CDP-alcohol phosphatidyltransferase family protein [Flavisolibacter sp.]|nr:CDP-alcohol phosphatidyltransferase family protein [Flavisolibacter sp.]
MKQIPNFFTLLNLLFGCIAIVFILQTGQSIVILNEQNGTYDPFFPEKLAWGALFIFLAAVVDFFDGFFARLFNASTAMGKQLDSLSDVVSFGVAPGLILYQLLRLGYAQDEGGLDVTFAALLPAFIFPCAVAWRLAKYNISTNQADYFIGVPSPAAALVIASFPLIIWNEYFQLQAYFINVWLLYAVIVLLSFLMLSNGTFLAIKIKDLSVKNNIPKYLLIILSIVSALFLKWLAVPIIFILYVVLSKFSNVPTQIVETTNRETLDVTV